MCNQFLADHTNGRAIGTLLRLSVCHRRLSVTLCIVAKKIWHLKWHHRAKVTIESL